MLKEIVLLTFALLVVSFAQDIPQNYILTNTVAPQWPWNNRRPGEGGYWGWGPTGWTWINPYGTTTTSRPAWANRPWWAWNNNRNPYYWNTTPYPGK